MADNPDLNNLIDALRGLITVGVLYRLVMCGIAAIRDSDKLKSIKERAINAVAFGVLSQIIIQVVQSIMSYYS